MCGSFDRKSDKHNFPPLDFSRLAKIIYLLLIDCLYMVYSFTNLEKSKFLDVTRLTYLYDQHKSYVLSVLSLYLWFSARTSKFCVFWIDCMCNPCISTNSL